MLSQAPLKHSCYNGCEIAVNAWILGQKLCFLQHLLDNDTAECAYVREPESKRITDLCLVRECKELEEVCGVEGTERILVGISIKTRIKLFDFCLNPSHEGNLS